MRIAVLLLSPCVLAQLATNATSPDANRTWPGSAEEPPPSPYMYQRLFDTDIMVSLVEGFDTWGVREWIGTPPMVESRRYLSTEGVDVRAKKTYLRFHNPGSSSFRYLTGNVTNVQSGTLIGTIRGLSSAADIPVYADQDVFARGHIFELAQDELRAPWFQVDPDFPGVMAVTGFGHTMNFTSEIPQEGKPIMSRMAFPNPDPNITFTNGSWTNEQSTLGRLSVGKSMVSPSPQPAMVDVTVPDNTTAFRLYGDLERPPNYIYIKDADGVEKTTYSIRPKPLPRGIGTMTFYPLDPAARYRLTFSQIAGASMALSHLSFYSFFGPSDMPAENGSEMNMTSTITSTTPTPTAIVTLAANRPTSKHSNTGAIVGGVVGGIGGAVALAFVFALLCLRKRKRAKQRASEKQRHAEPGGVEEPRRQSTAFLRHSPMESDGYTDVCSSIKQYHGDGSWGPPTSEGSTNPDYDLVAALKASRPLPRAPHSPRSLVNNSRHPAPAPAPALHTPIEFEEDAGYLEPVPAPIKLPPNYDPQWAEDRHHRARSDD